MELVMDAYNPTTVPRVFVTSVVGGHVSRRLCRSSGISVSV